MKPIGAELVRRAVVLAVKHGQGDSGRTLATWTDLSLHNMRLLLEIIDSPLQRAKGELRSLSPGLRWLGPRCVKLEVQVVYRHRCVRHF